MKLLKQIETLFRAGTAGGLTDSQLLDRFVQRRDEAAEGNGSAAARAAVSHGSVLQSTGTRFDPGRCTLMSEPRQRAAGGSAAPSLTNVVDLTGIRHYAGINGP
jgi:hypothetical protein